MDKYEFNIKVEQIKKLVNRGDYETAMRIADTIDWRRVRNASLLSMIAQIYEKNGEYQEAKDILLLALERAPIGKRLLYKLTDLALKEGSIAEAETYYREFCDLAQDDPRQYLLRYLILKAKKAPVEQLIRALETYTAAEVDEKWLYELASLYHQAGMGKECVGICDQIMLLFGVGKYVDQAMELKLQYAPLNNYQMDLVENRNKYEEKLRAVEEGYKNAAPEEERETLPEPQPEETAAPLASADVEKAVVMQLHEDMQTRKLAHEMSKISEEDMHTARVEEDNELEATRTLEDIRSIKDIKPTRRILEAEAEKEEAFQAAREQEELRKKEEQEAARREENEREIERQKAAIRAAREREEMEAETLRRMEEEREAARREEEERRLRRQAEIDRERASRLQPRNIPAPEEEEEEPQTNHLMIEAETDEKGLSIARDALKEIYHELGHKKVTKKISGETLNKRGISALAAKLEGICLIIEHAAALTTAVQNELDDLMEKDKSGMIVVLIDTPEKLEYLHGNNTSLAGKFQYIGAAQTETEEPEETACAAQPEEDQETEQAAVEPEEEYEETLPEYEEDEEEDEPEDDFYEEEPRKRFGFFGKKKIEEPEYEEPEEEDYKEAEDDTEEETAEEAASQEEPPKAASEEYDDKVEMDLDEFAQYACRYASEIDCSITGKSLLALYERIEMMEEDGVRLTRKAAVDLIEEAADKAEKPSFGRRIKGLFSPKYDREGYLILHEDNFFD